MKDKLMQTPISGSYDLPNNEDVNAAKAFVSFIVTVIIVGIVFALLGRIPDKLNIDEITKRFCIPIELFVAEQSEKARYILCTLLFPIVYIVTHVVVGKKCRWIETPFYIKYIKITGTIGLLGVVWVVNIADPFYINAIRPSLNILDNALKIIFVCTVFIVFSFFSINNKKINVIIGIIAISYLVSISQLYLTKTYCFGNNYVQYHSDAYFYPVYKVYCGQTPLVDFSSIYGFYPYFYTVIFRIFGGISIYSFSAITASLLILSLISVFYFLIKTLSNKIIALWGGLAVSFIVGIYPILLNSGFYLQYWPHRILFPMLLISYCTFIVNKHAWFWEGTGFLGASIALLWNIDTGIIVLLSYSVFLIYLQIFDGNISNKYIQRKILWIVIETLCSLLLAILVLMLITYIRTGKMIVLREVLFGQLAFYGSGFGMLRMPLVHPWWIVIGIYVVSLTKALRCIASIRYSNPKYSIRIGSIYFVLSILGIGLFSYYQGRSHDFVLPAVIWPCIVIVAIMTNEYFEGILLNKESKSSTDNVQNIIRKSKYFVSSLLLSILICALFISFNSEGYIINLQNKPKRITISWINRTIELSKYYKKTNRGVDLVMHNAAEIYAKLKERNIPPIPATIDIFTRDNCKKTMDYLEKTEKVVFFDDDTRNILQRYSPKEFEAFIARSVCVETSENLSVFLPVF
jgi:hypothetical protein